ncbi:MAG: V-type ATP synthase subunit A [Clostridiales bacterium]|jgi:V/A-type H+-transporting ATPase subunit A|nr:V-type ATP synthase subunit A [Clostridiales bacterium]
MNGKIIKVSGPLIVAEGMEDVRMYDVVRVSKQRLIGEVIELRGGLASVQVYEETSMLGPGEEVVTTNAPLSVELGPGIVEGIFDGIQRPLSSLAALSGDRIERGVEVSALDHKRKWAFTPKLKPGAHVTAGDVLGVVQENEIIEHRIMVPHPLSGEIVKLEKGDFTLDDTVAVLKTADGREEKLTMLQRWPVRRGRPYVRKLSPDQPLVTGQRVIDTLFPIAKGGVAAVPGPFGSGKTVVQHQLAKWADADMVVYIGCGERGNEMTDVLNEFPQLKDPKTGLPLMKRTILIANTSDMPVAAREASIYTGITIAEYFRDMGYSVAIMADSTSRWAEALREMSGRLEEMPGEEGYPAYLSSRLAEFYERAGIVEIAGSTTRIGAISAIGAVSPQGGDMSEPVSQATLRIVKVFWGLSSALAYKRHFPALDWLTSYSLYSDRLSDWYEANLGPGFNVCRADAMRILQEEARLDEIVRLVGVDALSPRDRVTMETAKSIREDYLHQNAFHETDTYTPLESQSRMLELILSCHKLSAEAVDKGIPIKKIIALPVREAIGRSKYIGKDTGGRFDEIAGELKAQFAALMEG